MVAADALGRWGFILFTFAVALLPVGFGGNRPLPLAAFQCALLLAVALAIYAPAIQWPRRIQCALALLGITLVWAAVQALPIAPAPLAHPLWAPAADALGIHHSGFIALDPHSVWPRLARLATYIAACIAAFVMLHDTARAKKFLAAVYGAAVVISLYGLFSVNSPTVLGITPSAYSTDVTGTFISRNHFAVYAAVALIIGIGLGWQALRHHSNKAAAAYAISLLPLAVAMLNSHSRAGLVAAALGLLVFVIAYLIYLRRHRLALLAPLVAALLLGVGSATLAPANTRWDTLFLDHSSSDRLAMYEKTTTAISQRPLLGHGLGNIAHTDGLMRQSNQPTMNRAHSDPLESLHDLGIPVALLLWGAIGLLMSGLAHGVRTRHQQGTYPAIALGAATTILAHSMVDFSLQIPAIAVLLAALLGCGLAHSWSRQR